MSKRIYPLFVIFLASFSICAKPVFAAAPQLEQTIEKLSKAIETHKGLKQNRAGYDIVFRRDPMRRLIDAGGNLVEEGLQGGLAVQGIIRFENSIFALVNDKFYAKGDTVGPYQILDIRPEGIDARRDGKTLFIPLYTQNQDA